MKNTHLKKTIIGWAALAFAALIVVPLSAGAQANLTQGGTGWATSSKGELLVGTSSPIRYSRFSPGSNGHMLVASSTSPYGLAWIAPTAAGLVNSVSSSDGSLVISPTSGAVDATWNQVQVDGSAFTTLDALSRQLWSGGSVTYDWSTNTLVPGGDIAFPNSFDVLHFGSDPSVSKSGLPLRLSWRTDGSSNGWLQFDDGAGNLFVIRANINAESVSGSTGAFSSLSGGTISGSGTGITGVPIVAGTTGTLTAARGGTGLASYTVGDLIYAAGSSTLVPLNDVATGNALISGGIATAPLWGKIDLTQHVSGTLPLSNGGTGVTTLAALASSTNYWTLGNGFLRLATTTDMVGIGTTSPASKLDVWGNLNVATGSVPALFVNTANGRIGIGTSSPIAKLNISNASALIPQFIMGYNQNAYASTTMDASGGTVVDITGSSASTPTWTYQDKITGNADIAVPRATSRFLIGTNNAISETLSGAAYINCNGVAASSTGANQVVKIVNTDAGNCVRMIYNNGISLMTNIGNGAAAGTSYSDSVNEAVNVALDGSTNIQSRGLGTTVGLTLYSSTTQPTNSLRAHVMYAEDNTAGGGAYPFLENGNLVLQPRTSSTGRDLVVMTGATTPTANLVVDRSSNTGIGSTTPAAKLGVKGSSGSAIPVLQVASSSNASLLNVQPGGNVGIGTSTPISNLHVTAAASNATSTLTIGKSGQSKGSCIELFSPAGTAVYVVASTTSPYGVESAAVGACR